MQKINPSRLIAGTGIDNLRCHPAWCSYEHPLMRTSYADPCYGRSARLAYSGRFRFRSPSEVHSALCSLLHLTIHSSLWKKWQSLLTLPQRFKVILYQKIRFVNSLLKKTASRRCRFSFHCFLMRRVLGSPLVTFRYFITVGSWKTTIRKTPGIILH